MFRPFCMQSLSCWRRDALNGHYIPEPFPYNGHGRSMPCWALLRPRLFSVFTEKGRKKETQEGAFHDKWIISWSAILYKQIPCSVWGTDGIDSNNICNNLFWCSGNIFGQQRVIYNGPYTYPDALQYWYSNSLLGIKFNTSLWITFFKTNYIH